MATSCVGKGIGIVNVKPGELRTQTSNPSCLAPPNGIVGNSHSGGDLDTYTGYTLKRRFSNDTQASLVCPVVSCLKLGELSRRHCPSAR
jgi:hypothetical protein